MPKNSTGALSFTPTIGAAAYRRNDRAEFAALFAGGMALPTKAKVSKGRQRRISMWLAGPNPNSGDFLETAAFCREVKTESVNVNAGAAIQVMPSYKPYVRDPRGLSNEIPNPGSFPIPYNDLPDDWHAGGTFNLRDPDTGKIIWSGPGHYYYRGKSQALNPDSGNVEQIMGFTYNARSTDLAAMMVDHMIEVATMCGAIPGGGMAIVGKFNGHIRPQRAHHPLRLVLGAEKGERIFWLRDEPQPPPESIEDMVNSRYPIPIAPPWTNQQYEDFLFGLSLEVFKRTGLAFFATTGSTAADSKYIYGRWVPDVGFFWNGSAKSYELPEDAGNLVNPTSTDPQGQSLPEAATIDSEEDSEDEDELPEDIDIQQSTG